MGRVVVVGSANVDMVIPVPRLPGSGETVLGGPLEQYFGGKGANQAVAARRAGATVALVARFGRDDFGRRYRAFLTRTGINLSASTTAVGASTGVALISVDKAGRNQIAVAGGANSTLEEDHIERAVGLLRRADVLLCQLEVPMPAVGAALRAAKAFGVRTILNPAPARPLPRRLLKYADLLTPNESEAASLTGLPTRTVGEVRRAAQALLALGCGAVCVTLGARGALLAEAEGVEHIQAFKVKAVDTTGCGDAFNGALAAAWATGRPLSDAIRWGVAAGALAATVKGAQPSLPLARAIKRLLAGLR
ncbi:MAG: ribokinase [Nitrospinae bacterium]|nr:ribokinase [Nitrospinota bacterium]